MLRVLASWQRVYTKGVKLSRCVSVNYEHVQFVYSPSNIPPDYIMLTLIFCYYHFNSFRNDKEKAEMCAFRMRVLHCAESPLGARFSLPTLQQKGVG